MNILRRVVVVLASVGVFAIAVLQFNTTAIADDAVKTKQVEVKDIKLAVPTSWKQEKPSSSLRLTQFRIPAADGDKEDAELSVFSFGASSVVDNVKRWTGQFDPNGREAKVTSGEAEIGKYVFVEVSGIYNKPVGPPVFGKTEAVPDSRMYAVLLTTDKGVYYLKLTGPDKTVSGEATTLRASFGGDAAKEKEYKLED